jgi:DNA-directed RNA polymerase specialized sigma54-like protein
MRTQVEAMAATQGHTQSLHTNALDEALALPTDFSARIARNTQLFLQQESGTTRIIDPWGGSYYVERLTEDLAQKTWGHIREVEALGGMAKAVASGMPKLRINDLYAQAMRGQRNGSAGGLSTRLQEARWFMKNIQQRFDTILRVSKAIVERQKSYFTHGAIAMKPLVLREIADELGLHESTISRVTSAKYMATPYGTFELKYFFGSSLNTEAGGNASSTAVRALIQQLVGAEDLGKPLSDSQLSQMLEEQGIQVARRTVAKYREALKIAPASLRKAI